MKNDSKGYEICSAGFYCPEGTGSDLRPCKAGNGTLETDTTLRADVLFSHHAAEYMYRASQVCPHSHISSHSRFIRFVIQIVRINGSTININGDFQKTPA